MIWQRKHISSPATRTRDLWRCAQKELTSGENPDLYFWIYSSCSSHGTRSVSWPGAEVAVQDPRLFMQPQLLTAPGWGTPSCSDTHRGKGIQGICPQREFPLSCAELQPQATIKATADSSGCFHSHRDTGTFPEILQGSQPQSTPAARNSMGEFCALCSSSSAH